MIIKFNIEKFRAYHGLVKGTGVGYFLRNIVQNAGGKVNTNGRHLVDLWTIEFDNEEDAVAFKLIYGM